MTDPRLYLLEDPVARGWEPFSTTRPVGELLYGTARLRERAERALGLRCAGYVGAPELAGFSEEGAPEPVAPETGIPGPEEREAPRILLLSRCALDLPPGEQEPAGRALLERVAQRGEPALLVVDEQPVGWAVPPGAEVPDPAALLSDGDEDDGIAAEDLPGGHEPEVLEGEVLDAVWDLVSQTPHAVHRDLSGLTGEAPRLDDRVVRLGPEGSLTVHPSAEVEPGAVLDTREGPISLEAESRVATGTKLAGPAWVGPGTELLGGDLRRVALGPVCKVRGEVDSCVFLGYVNKAHDGYMGHAYLGQWVNLGAMTTNSDLKNNYRPVRLRFPEGEVDTGLLKLGCFLGDHVRTGIGTLLNTGTVVGVGSNLFGGAMPPVWVPPFRWGAGSELVDYDIDRFLETARTVMGRRGRTLPAEAEQLLRRVWEAHRVGEAP